MSRRARMGAIVLGALVLLALLLPRLVDVNSFRPRLESELSAALGRQVKIDNLSLSVFSGSVFAENISIADDPAFSKEPFVSAKSLKASVEIMPLIFSKTLHITAIALDEPEIALRRSAGGPWNFSTLGGRAAAPPPASDPKSEKESFALSVDKLSIANGRMMVGAANSAEKPDAYDKVNLDVTDFSAATEFPFVLTAALPGGGSFKLKGKCGPLHAGNAGGTPFQAAMTVDKLDLAAGLAGSSSGLQGVADFDGEIRSDGQLAKVTGSLKTEKLKLAAKGAPSKRPIEVKYALEHNLKTDSGTLTQGDVIVGKAVSHLTGTYQSQGQTTSLNMKFNGSDLPVDELEAALPAIGVVLPSGSKLQGGSLSIDLGIAGPTASPVISGGIRLSNAKLAGFDMGSKLSAIPGLGGKQSGKDTTIQNLSATVRVAPENIQANAINLNIPSLAVVTGDGNVSPAGVLNFNMSATLDRGTTVPFAVEGTASDPKFVPNVKAVAGNAAKQAISEKVTGKTGGKLGRRK